MKYMKFKLVRSIVWHKNHELCQDLATPTASPAEPRGRSPTPRGEVGKDVAPRGNQKKSQELEGSTGSTLQVELAVASLC